MYFIISIALATILGWLLFMMGPFIGGMIAFGIIAGTLFRALYLLHDVHKRLSKITPTPTKAQEAYENYVKEKGLK